MLLLCQDYKHTCHLFLRLKNVLTFSEKKTKHEKEKKLINESSFIPPQPRQNKLLMILFHERICPLRFSLNSRHQFGEGQADTKG